MKIKRTKGRKWLKKLDKIERKNSLILFTFSKSEMEEAFDHPISRKQWKRIKTAFWESAIMSDVLGKLTEATASVLNVDDREGTSD